MDGLVVAENGMDSVRVRLRRNALEAQLVRRNWTRAHLAHLVGIHRSYLSDVLAGRRYVGPTLRQRLLETLGATFDDFFEIIAVRRSPPSDRKKRPSRERF